MLRAAGRLTSPQYARQIAKMSPLSLHTSSLSSPSFRSLRSNFFLLTSVPLRYHGNASPKQGSGSSVFSPTPSSNSSNAQSPSPTSPSMAWWANMRDTLSRISPFGHGHSHAADVGDHGLGMGHGHSYSHSHSHTTPPSHSHSHDGPAASASPSSSSSSSSSSGSSSASSGPPMTPEAAQQEEMRITRVGFLWNVALTGLKFVAGVVGGSISLIADAAHSVSDMLSDGVTMLTIKHASRPADVDHPYGHGRIEDMGTLVVSGIVTLTGLGIGWHAIDSIVDYHSAATVVTDALASNTGTAAPTAHSHGHSHGHGHGHGGGGIIEYVMMKLAGTDHWEPAASHHGPPASIALAVALFAVGSKEWLFRATRAVAVRTQSRIVEINAWHHRSDAASSMVAVVGIAGAMAKWPLLDPLAALVVAAAITKQGVDMGVQVLHDITDRQMPPELYASLSRAVATCAPQGVLAFHGLRGRRMGRYMLVDVSIVVPNTFSVSAAHQAAEAVRTRVLASRNGISEVLVHVDVDGDERHVHTGLVRVGDVAVAASAADATSSTPTVGPAAAVTNANTNANAHAHAHAAENSVHAVHGDHDAGAPSSSVSSSSAATLSSSTSASASSNSSTAVSSPSSPSSLSGQCHDHSHSAPSQPVSECSHDHHLAHESADKDDSCSSDRIMRSQFEIEKDVRRVIAAFPQQGDVQGPRFNVSFRNLTCHYVAERLTVVVEVSLRPSPLSSSSSSSLPSSSSSSETAPLTLADVSRVLQQLKATFKHDISDVDEARVTLCVD